MPWVYNAQLLRVRKKSNPLESWNHLCLTSGNAWKIIWARLTMAVFNMAQEHG